MNEPRPITVGYTTIFIPDADGQGWRYRVYRNGFRFEGRTGGTWRDAERDARARFQRWLAEHGHQCQPRERSHSRASAVREHAVALGDRQD